MTGGAQRRAAVEEVETRAQAVSRMRWKFEVA